MIEPILLQATAEILHTVASCQKSYKLTQNEVANILINISNLIYNTNPDTRESETTVDSPVVNCPDNIPDSTITANHYYVEE